MAIVRAALLLAAVWALWHALAFGDRAAWHGRERVATHTLTAPELAPHVGAAAPAWAGPQQAAGSGRNPYTLVVEVRGAARTDGDVRLRWQAGWEVRESASATREVLMSLAPAVLEGVSAGAPVALKIVGTPLSFRGERDVAPLLRLLAADNLELHDVRLHVWSGRAPLVWPTVRPDALFWAGLCLLGWFAVGRWSRPALAPRFQPSTVRGADSVMPAAEPPTSVRAPISSTAAVPRHREAAPPAPAAATWAPAAATSAPGPSPAASAPPAVAAPNHGSRVLASLREVLGGLASPAEPDLQRRPRRGPPSTAGT